MTPLLALLAGSRAFGFTLGKKARMRSVLFTTTPVNNFQVRVLLTTSSFDYSKVKANGDDIRFWNQDTLTEEIPYWIEQWNPTGTSILWIKVPAAGKTKVYMSYGDPGASTPKSSIYQTMDDAIQFMYYAGGSSSPFSSLDGGGQDSTVNYNWGSNTVIVNGFGSRAENVSIRWKGWITPYATGSHTFYCTTDDGSRVYLGSSQAASSSTVIINSWMDQGPTIYTASASLTEGSPRFFQYEWFETGGGATAQISWATPVGGNAVIPSYAWKGPKYHSSYGDSFLYSGATISNEI